MVIVKCDFARYAIITFGRHDIATMPADIKAAVAPGSGHFSRRLANKRDGDIERQ